MPLQTTVRIIFHQQNVRIPEPLRYQVYTTHTREFYPMSLSTSAYQMNETEEKEIEIRKFLHNFTGHNTLIQHSTVFLSAMAIPRYCVENTY